jgi:hypothetical protein
VQHVHAVAGLRAARRGSDSSTERWPGCGSSGGGGTGGGGGGACRQGARRHTRQLRHPDQHSGGGHGTAVTHTHTHSHTHPPPPHTPCTSC